jgi:hypothetical protein
MADKLVALCPGLFIMQGSGSSRKAVVTSARGNEKQLEKVRRLLGEGAWAQHLVLAKRKHHFIFTVESTGGQRTPLCREVVCNGQRAAGVKLGADVVLSLVATLLVSSVWMLIFAGPCGRGTATGHAFWPGDRYIGREGHQFVDDAELRMGREVPWHVSWLGGRIAEAFLDLFIAGHATGLLV